MKKRVLSVVDEIFFASKIRAAAESAGAEFESARAIESAVEKALANRPGVVLADLHSERCDALALAARFKAEPELAGVRLVGFYSHAQTELRDRAQASGFDLVIPRSVFSARLPEIIAGEPL